MKYNVELDDEQIEAVFENTEVKFSKAKMKKLKAMAMTDELPLAIEETLQERLMEFLEELVEEEWGD